MDASEEELSVSSGFNSDDIHDAAILLDEGELLRCLAAGVPVDHLFDGDTTALHFACIAAGQGDNKVRAIRIIRILLRAGASPNLVNDRGLSPLHIAAQMSGAPIVKLLIQAGADVNLVDNDGGTALHFAAMLDKRECVAALVTARIDVRRQDDAGMSALAHAIAHKNRHIIPILVRAGAWDYQGFPSGTFSNDARQAASPYLRKLRDAGSWQRYEERHRRALATALARVVFSGLPVEMVSEVVAFAFHTGYY